MRISIVILLVGLLCSSIAFAGDAKKGKDLFSTRGCVACHAIGTDGTATTGPNLLDVTRRRKAPWITKWLKNPDAMRSDPIIADLKVKYPADMPNLGLSDTDVADLIAYLELAHGTAGK